MQANFGNLNVYSTETDTKWNPVSYTSNKEGSTQVISIQIHSEYGKPLLGDLVVVFSSEQQVPEFQLLILPGLLMVILLVPLISKQRKQHD
jgi:hypothetical protein